MTAPADDDFTPWHGGKRPVPFGTLVEVKHRNGKRWICRAGEDYARDWSHEGVEHIGEIVAWRMAPGRSDMSRQTREELLQKRVDSFLNEIEGRLKMAYPALERHDTLNEFAANQRLAYADALKAAVRTAVWRSE